MALFTCPDCMNRISTDASSCPGCGCTTFDVPTGQRRTVKCPSCEVGTSPCDECGAWRGWHEREYKSLKDGSTWWRRVGGIGQPGAPW